ncbi:MAG: hypothetical protein WCE73_07830 [Candidatus Angelobacter sp.]
MTSAVAVRHILGGCEQWNANGAGDLQGEAYYRHKRDNSHPPLKHRTKTHVRLSLACPES